MDPIQQQQQQQRQQQNINYNGMQTQQQRQQQPTNNSKNVRKKAYVKIIEQPAGKALRFRYECEGRSAGSIPGVNSTPETKTYPTIEIVGFKGRAVVVVSCVTKDQPYRPHPHNLVGKEGCKKGVCTLEINSETMRAVFSNLGIQCVKKKDIEAALKAREEIRVDPFKTGFTHRFQPSSIDLNSVRLCFQVFMESDQKGSFTQPLAPVVSEPIYDKKAMCDLVICRLCSCSATVLGNTQIILLCEKVAKDDISVRFYEENNGQTIWEAFGEFQHTDVHKQTAIAFKTPRYRKIDITEPAKVFVQLKRPSDGITSEALQFEYLPLDSDPAHLKRKRKKANGDPLHLVLQQQNNQHGNDRQGGGQTNINCWNGTNTPAEIKTEPRDVSPQACGMYPIPPNLTPSPQPLSPSNAYTHNTPSPSNKSTPVPADAQCNPHATVPNQHYNINNNNAVGGSNALPLMDVGDYNGFGLQTQPYDRDYYGFGQQAQPYHNNNFGGAGASHWDMKYNPATGGRINNLNNLNTPSNFTGNNISTAANITGGPGSSANGTSWNLTAGHFHPHHLQIQQQTKNNGTANNINGITNTAVTNANSGSNILTFDNINSQDQKILQLSPEDLQISNLSISL